MGETMGGRGLERLTAVIADAEALARKHSLTEPELAASLEDIYLNFFEADFSDYDLGDVRRLAPDLIARNFDAYLSLRDAIAGWHAEGLMSRRVQIAIRNVFRAARYARDLLGEIQLGHPRLARKENTHSAFAGPEIYTQRHPALGPGPIELRPGDILLQRGRVHNSAAIARIGDVDSQFSHVSIVAPDDDGNLVMVEALIEEGSIVTSLDVALAHGIGRAILFRCRDRELAERSSRMIREAIVRTAAPAGTRILYDFTMEVGGYQELYCAKLVRLAYSMGSTGDLQLPTFATRLDMKNRDFVDRIGVTATHTFAPGDMELEPGFDIVAEWHDYRVSSELRLKDMIMLKLFEWMESHDYRFQPTLFARFIGRFGAATAHWPAFLQRLAKRIAGKVPPNMGAAAVTAVAMLHWTAEELYAELRKLEDAAVRDSGRQLHPRLVLGHLERMRTERGHRVGYLTSRHG
jgi:hypothetical protein